MPGRYWPACRRNINHNLSRYFVRGSDQRAALTSQGVAKRWQPLDHRAEGSEFWERLAAVALVAFFVIYGVSYSTAVLLKIMRLQLDVLTWARVECLLSNRFEQFPLLNVQLIDEIVLNSCRAAKLFDQNCGRDVNLHVPIGGFGCTDHIAFRKLTDNLISEFQHSLLLIHCGCSAMHVM